MSVKINYLISKALETLGLGNLIDANNFINEALKIKTNNFDALHIKGVICGAENNHNKAVEYFKKAIKINSANCYALSNLAKALSEIGRNEEAIEYSAKAALINPTYLEAWLIFGKSLFGLGRYKDAIEKFDYVININPKNIMALANKGATLNELKDYANAIIHFDRALSLNVNYPEIFKNKGVSLIYLKQYSKAIECFENAIAINPNYCEAWTNKGVASSYLRDYEDAILCFNTAISINISDVEALTKKGLTLNQIERYEEAHEILNQVIDLNPKNFDALYGIGLIFYKKKNYEKALAWIDKSLVIKSDSHEAFSIKGACLYQLKKFNEALICFEMSVALDTGFEEAWANKAAVHNELGQYLEAIFNYDKSIALRSDYIEARINKAITLIEVNQYEEAILSLENAIKINKEFEFLFGFYLHFKMMICDWKDFDLNLVYLEKCIRENKKISAPFFILGLNDDPRMHLKAGRIFAKEFNENYDLDFEKNLGANEKIKIGYYSADFHNHATTYLMAELFELHDKDKFEIHGFSFGPAREDEMKQRVSASLSSFNYVGLMSDKEISELSRDIGIDIAIDLKGYTKNSRTGIFSERCAPIQVNYLGYPGSMGADYIDYIIADQKIIPENNINLYTEKIIYLPHTYQPNDRKRKISSKEFSKKDLGIPEDFFVYCCFNNNYKITPALFKIWMRILSEVKSSVLLLLEDNIFASKNLHREAKEHGINPARIIFIKRIPLDEHLARHKLADLFIDTFPYNAHTTASDALWTGLPLLTYCGESFASRVSASLLSAIEMQELITYSMVEYEFMAIELAINKPLLKQINNKLRENLESSKLFDTVEFTKNIESAYITIYEAYNSKQVNKITYI